MKYNFNYTRAVNDFYENIILFTVKKKTIEEIFPKSLFEKHFGDGFSTYNQEKFYQEGYYEFKDLFFEELLTKDEDFRVNLVFKEINHSGNLDFLKTEILKEAMSKDFNEYKEGKKILKEAMARADSIKKGKKTNSFVEFIKTYDEKDFSNLFYHCEIETLNKLCQDKE
jgi:hypothetical protein